MNPSLNTVTLNLTEEDTLWDKTFENSQDLLERLADEAHENYLAGETEDFDPDEEI